jgi:GT2 family glycosyltransferase
MHDVSVLTIVRDRHEHLLQLIEGLRRSSVLPDELVILDMNPQQQQLPEAEFPIRSVHLPSARQKIPLAQARNRAAQTARSRNLVFLDVDCIPMRGLLAALTAACQARDALICAEVHYLATDEARGTWDEAGLRLTAARHPVRQFPAEGLRFEVNRGLFWSLAFAIRRDRFLALGGFDERFAGYGGEDTDFSVRAGAAGIELAFLGGPGVFHQHHEIYDPPLQHFCDIVRNAQLFFDIHARWAMEGWLDAFVDMGLVAIEHGRLRILRLPSDREIAAARRNDAARY